jgi:hypothetical protein
MVPQVRTPVLGANLGHCTPKPCLSNPADNNQNPELIAEAMSVIGMFRQFTHP